MAVPKSFEYPSDPFGALSEGIAELTRLVYLYARNPSAMRMEMEIEEKMEKMESDAKKVGGLLVKEIDHTNHLLQNFLRAPTDKGAYVMIMHSLERLKNEVRSF